MVIDKELAMKVWEAIFGDKEVAVDCFGAYIRKDYFSDKPVLLASEKNGKTYDYSWTLSYIRPLSSFDDPKKGDILNNLEPMNRLFALEKEESGYPAFTVHGESFKVVRCLGYDGYGIVDKNNIRVDWKGREKRMFGD